MRNTHHVKGFYVSHKSWYAPSLPKREAEIMVGLYHPEGGTSGEFGIRWMEVGKKLTPRLEIFDDAWKMFFANFAELSALATLTEDATDDDVIALLLRLGYIDRTEYVQPGSLKTEDWAHDNRKRIATAVSACDAATLRKVAELIGWQEAK